MTETTGRSRLALRRRSLAAVSGLVVLLVVVGLIVHAHDGGGSDRLPYTDPAASGVIGLCNAAGQPVESGSTTSTPFVWLAVGATAAPTAYAGTGATATLYAYQPRAGVDPGDWSGQLLTSSGTFTNPAHPMAQATGKDIDLAAFVAAYPAKLDGLVQLRLYLGAPGAPLLTTSYDATDIKVTGSKWRVVRGGTESCTDGHSVSLETQVQPTSSRPTS